MICNNPVRIEQYFPLQIKKQKKKNGGSGKKKKKKK